jgi:GDPmannose 4,6-dehydratase
MLQQDTPQDFVIGTGETHSVREFCQAAFNYIGLDYQAYVIQDERFYRPLESAQLVSDPEKANRVLGWKPSVSFEALVHQMVDADLALTARELAQ